MTHLDSSSAPLSDVAERLRRSFQVLFHSSSQPMLIGDGRGGLIRDANAGLCELLGLSREEILRKTVPDFLLGGRAENDSYSVVRAATGAMTGTTQIRRGDGRVIEITFWSVEHRDEGGELQVFIGVNAINSRLDPLQTNFVLRAHFDDSPDGKLVVSPTGHTLYTNKRHLDFWGLTHEDLDLPFGDRWPKTKQRLQDPSAFVGMQKAIERDPAANLTITMDLVDGRTVEVRTEPLGRDGEGPPARSFTTRDVTSQVRAQRDLAAVATLLRSVSTNSPEGILVVDLQGRVIHHNQLFLEMWRVDETFVQLSSAQRWDVLLPMVNQRSVTADSRLLGKEMALEYEGEFAMKDGRTIMMQAVGLRDSSGELLGRASFYRDVTADRNAAAALGRDASLLEAVSTNSPLGTIAVDLDGQLLHCSERFLEIWGLDDSWTGLTKDEQTDAHVKKFADPEHYWRAWKQITGAGVVEYEDEFASVDGKTVVLHVVPLRDASGAVLGRAFFFRDVTAERNAEAVLRDSEERYRTLVLSMAEGLVLRDSDGTIIASNTAAEQILGLTRDELAGRVPPDPGWRTIREDGTPLQRTEYSGMVSLATGAPRRGVVMGVCLPSGAVRWVSSNSQPIARPGEMPHAVVTSFQDITEQRQVGEAQAKARTVEAFHSLASGVAHKINNSLTSIVGNAYLAGLSAGLPEETEESLTEIVSAASGATTLVRDLLALSGRGRQTLESVDLSLQVGGVLNGLAPEERRVVQEELSTVLPEVLVDPASLTQAISAVLRNALEAGDRVAVTTRRAPDFEPGNEASYAPSRPPAGPYLAIEVSDNGPGIPREIEARLFEPFATTKFAGRGLGLAAAAGIMGTHHGFVEVRSSPAGCRVTLLFPSL